MQLIDYGVELDFRPKLKESPQDGLDADGRPRAAGFNAAQADLAQKAAESLELQVLRIETAEQIELARQLPSGEILAPGRGHVPVVRKELLDRLLALVPPPDSGSSKGAASTVEVDATTSVARTDNSGPASKALPPKQTPTTWAEIDVGDLVLAENWDPETGWYEAVVLEQLGDDAFKLRFRDYPEEGTLVRRRNQLALLSPA